MQIAFDLDSQAPEINGKNLCIMANVNFSTRFALQIRMSMSFKCDFIFIFLTHTLTDYLSISFFLFQVSSFSY